MTELDKSGDREPFRRGPEVVLETGGADARDVVEEPQDVLHKAGSDIGRLLDQHEGRVRAEQQAVLDRLADNALYASPEGMAEVTELGRRQAQLGRLVGLYDERSNLTSQLYSARQALSDPEVGELAAEEVKDVEAQLARTDESLVVELAPKDPLDEKDVIIEIRAGVGGDEAALFARDLYSMYTHFAQANGWGVELMSEAPAETGGFREVIFAVRGQGAYGVLKYESGGHRVQRVPETETQGRIHTSASTVAVMPEAEEKEVEISENDLKIDYYRSTGPGGQSVNTTDSAVRITHEPTGIVVSCQDEKSQLKNRNKAMSVLRSRILVAELERRRADLDEMRRELIGAGGRSERIRTYNFHDDRVTDHRIGVSQKQLGRVLGGEIGPLTEALRYADLKRALETVE